MLSALFHIRPAQPQDTNVIWSILKPVIRTGETYTLPEKSTREETLAYWFAGAHEVFIAEEDDTVVGTYFLQANQAGRGAHIANCGYVTAPDKTGRGIARAMCKHSLYHAKAKGFRAMQFNFVVSTNERAIRLWTSLGFEIVGRLPDVFQHPTLGFVDALVMHRKL